MGEMREASLGHPIGIAVEGRKLWLDEVPPIPDIVRRHPSDAKCGECKVCFWD